MTQAAPTSPLSIPVAPEEFPRRIKASDFNGDGELDIVSVYTSGTQTNIETFLGNGQGEFSSYGTFSIAAGPSAGSSRNSTNPVANEGPGPKV